MAAEQGRRWTLTGPGAVSSHAAKGQPPPSARNAQASLSWRRHGVPEPSAPPVTLPCLRTAGPRRPPGPGWTGGCNASRGPRALEGEMPGFTSSPGRQRARRAGAGRDLRWRPSPHRRRRRCMIRPWRPAEPGHLAGRRRGWLHSGRWPSRLGPWPAVRPPVWHHLAPGPCPGQTGPASVADQQTAHVMAVAAAAPPHHRGQPQSAKPEPPATSRQLARG
jgi:hypothetical protein